MHNNQVIERQGVIKQVIINYSFCVASVGRRKLRAAHLNNHAFNRLELQSALDVCKRRKPENVLVWTLSLKLIPQNCELFNDVFNDNDGSFNNLNWPLSRWSFSRIIIQRCWKIQDNLSERHHHQLKLCGLVVLTLKIIIRKIWIQMNSSNNRRNCSSYLALLLLLSGKPRKTHL